MRQSLGRSGPERRQTKKNKGIAVLAPTSQAECTMKDEAPRNAKKEEKKPWPMSWVVIAILLYLLIQTAWIAFAD